MPNPNIMYLAMTNTFEPWGDPNVRKAIALGIDALMFSADQATSEERVDQKKTPLKDTLMMWGTVAFSFVLSLGLFFYLPIILTDLVVAEGEGSVVRNIVDGFFRVLMFVLYLWAISKLPDMARVFEYHGAPEKTAEAHPEPHVFQIGDVDYRAVIIPSAPVPVGGSLIFVPADSVRPANVSVDALMSIYVSMGVTGPQFLPGSKP